MEEFYHGYNAANKQWLTEFLEMQPSAVEGYDLAGLQGYQILPLCVLHAT